jgi:Tfp pilus assembly protein PilF
MSRRSQATQTDRTARPLFVALGLVHHQAGRFAQAEALYLQALKEQTNNADALYLLGVLRHQQGNALEAVNLLTNALAIAPDHPEAHNNIGVALRGLGRLAEAAESYREALRLRPDYPGAHNNLGNVLSDLGRLVEAEASYREALRLRPDCPETHNNLGVVLTELGRPAEALACYERVLAIRPDDASAHFGRSRPLLLRGEYAEGWREFEWRSRGGTAEKVELRGFSEPQWQGEDVAGKTLLLHAEQGFGDTLQFCRYASLVGDTARVILEVKPALARLCSSLAGITQVVARGEPLPAFDLHCPLMSLPLAFGTTLDTIPSKVPYLTADPTLVADWRERLTCLDGLRVGLVWAGARRLEPELIAIDRRRSITLAMMAPLGEVSGVSFISLQKGEPAAQSANAGLGLALHDFTDSLQDFADTAALIEALDLVISVDTSVAHLAGALGKPIWLLNRFDTCWRWLLDRDDSPWYPQLRQFRQPIPGDWTSVMCAVRDALQRRTAATGRHVSSRHVTSTNMT